MPYLYKLKLLNGPLAGRELSLKEGIFTLGSGDSDVFLILDDEINQISLDVKEEGVTLLPPINGWIENEEFSSLTDIPVNKKIGVAGVGFVIGHPNDELKNFAGWVKPSQRKSPSIHLYVWITIAIASLLTFILFCILTFYEPEKTAPSTDIHQWIAFYQDQLPMQNLHFLWQSDGSLIIKGWCLRERDLKPLLEKLRQEKIDLRNMAICQDKLIENVRYAIHLYGYEHVQVESGEGHNEVVINGSIQDDARWQQIEALLSSMPGLKNWRVVNQSDSDVALLIEKLRDGHLLGMLSVRRANGRIVVSGKLNDKQLTMFSSIVRRYMAKKPDADTVTFQNISSTGGDSGVLPAPIISVGGNAQSPFLELSNGMRLQKGAVLPSGYIIRNIDSENGIELSLRGQLIHIPLGF